MSGLTLGAGYHITYGYDTAGRFNTLAWNAAGQSGSGTYSYVPDANLLQGFATASGVQTTYGYEPQRNLKTSVQNRFNGSTISQYDYVYDPLGRRRSAANTGSAFAQAAFSRYGYNDRSELINAGRYLGADINDTANPVTAEQRAYLYDPMGNRTRAEAAAAPVDYLTNQLNQYTDIGGALPVYDDDGNMTATADGRIYTYNTENRLIAAQPQTPAQGDTRTEFVYDYMGRRVQKIVSTWQTDHWSPTTEHLYLYDGWNLIKETTIPAGASAVDKYYVWGLDLSQSQQGAGGVGGLVASVQGSLTYNYLYDANGNVGQVIDAADGLIAAHYEYDPYGNLVNQSGAYADENPYRFSTKYFDPETNLYYYGYRYYAPELGRWINRDPKDELSFSILRNILIDDHLALSSYRFVQNSPINQIDTLGLIFGLPGIDKKLKRRAWNFPAVGVESSFNFSIGLQAAMGKGIMFFPGTCELASYFYKTDLSILKDPYGRPLHLGNDLSFGASSVIAKPGSQQSNRGAGSWTGNFYTATMGHDYWNAGVSYTDPPSWEVIGIGPSISFIKEIPTSIKYIVTNYDLTPSFEASLLPSWTNLPMDEKTKKLIKRFGLSNPFDLEKKLPCICNQLREAVADVAAPDFSLRRKGLMQ